MSKTDRIFYHTRRKSFLKNKDINIKVDLKDEAINDKLLNYKCQDFNLLLNYQIPQKKKLSFFSFTNSKKKNKAILNEISEEVNKTEIQYSNTESFTDSSFRETLADTSFDSQKSSKTESNNSYFKLLLNEDYNTYLEILKKIYPSFEFNHYNKIKDEYYEYFKKYGDNDINNRNSKYNIYNNNKNEIYKKSNLLDILGVQKNISVPSENFRIKDDFLSRSDITELKMIKDDLSFKTSIIDKELESILETQAYKFYNYIEANESFTKLISNYSEELKLKIEKQKIIKKNYISNSMKLILKQKKKKELEKLLNITYYMNDLKKYINHLKNLSATSNKDENIFRQISEYTNLSKEKIKYLKKYFINKNTKFLSVAENIINIYENKGELNLIEQFTSNVKKLIEICLIYDEKKNFILNTKDNINNNNNKEINNKSWKLNLEEKILNNILFVENDFEFIDNDKNIFIKYLFIYNNINKKNILKLVLNILDLFYIIKKDNLDITLIISIFQEIFKKIINYNLKEIENQTTNKLLLIKIISNCYSILLSNYCYIIYLIQINFSLNSKSFNELTNLMKIQMDKLIIDLIKSYLNEILWEDWEYFIDGYLKAKNNCEIYFSINNLNWDKITCDIYEQFIMHFKELETRELMNEYNKNNNINLSWDQKVDISPKYQKMFEKLYIETNINKIKLKQIDINQKNNKNNNLLSLYDSEQNNYLYFINEIDANDCGHKISNFSYLFIKYVYDFLYIYILTNNQSLKKILVNHLYKVTKDLLLYSEDIIVNNPTGLINNTKKITEKEISLYYSDLLVIENCLKNFLNLYPDQDINEILYELKCNCIDNIEDSMEKINNEIIEEFNNLEFDKYQCFNNNNEVNIFAKLFHKFKKLYDYLGNALTSENIKEMYNNKLETLLNDINQIIMTKGIINEEKKIKQFKNDIFFIKKIISLLSLEEASNFNAILDNCINSVIPK